MPPRAAPHRSPEIQINREENGLRGDEEARAAELAELARANEALQAQIAALQAAEQARPLAIRTHLPEKFEGRKDDFPQFLEDVRSYCALTNVPPASRVDYAVRCLGKTVKRVWLSKLAVYQRQNPGAEITLDVFGTLLSSVYDNSDRVSKARDKLDNVYQGREAIEKYVERFTTLAAEVEVGGDLSMGEKIHRFRKGLREDLKKVAAIDPTTGRQFEDLDSLIQTLTRYEAALGGGQERRTRSGAPSVATTSVDGDRMGQAWAGQGWTGGYQMAPQWGHNPYAAAAAPMLVPQQGTYFMPLPTVAGALPMPPPSATSTRRDGLPPELRRDTRVAVPDWKECYACGLKGHEKWGCPWKFMRDHPDILLPDRPFARTLRANIRALNTEGKDYPFVPEGRHLHLMREMGARLWAPQAAPAQWDGLRGRGGWRGRGRGRGGRGRGGRGRGRW